MAIKSTFTLDDDTVHTIRVLAEREGKAQSHVVREAVAHYAARDEKTTSEERERLLRTFDDLVARVARRPQAALEREIADLKRERRAGWSRGGRR
jgi:hypothetical protein